MDSFFLALLIGILILLYYYIKFDFAEFFTNVLAYVNSKSPFVGFLASHIAAADILGIAIFGFLSKLFFLPLPSEPYFLYAYEKGANVIILVLVMTFAGLLASLINYSVGVLFSNYYVNKHENTKKFAEKIKNSKFVSLFIFGAAILPVPDVFSLIFGALRVNLKKYLIWTIVGVLAKEVFMLAAFDYLYPFVQALF